MYPFRKLTAIIITVFALIIGLYNLYIEYYSERLIVPVQGKLFFAVLFIITIATAAICFCLSTNNMAQRKIYIRRFVILLFAYYLLMLMNLLFFDSTFGRIATSNLSFRDYFLQTGNIRPFHTIRRFWLGWQNGVMSMQGMVINIFGNLGAFAPMGFFLPTLFKGQRHFLHFFLTTLCATFSVELLQVLTRLGTGDIDDLILNLTGAILSFLFMQLPFLKKLWQKI